MEDKKELGSEESVANMGVGSLAVLVDRDPKKSPFLKRVELLRPTTDNETLVHLIKGSLGTGVLAMPYAFSNAGIALGIPATLFVGFVCAYCVHILVAAAQELCWRHNRSALDFGEIAELAVLHGPKSTRKLGGVARTIIKTFIVLAAMGACCVYIVFVSENISLVMNYYLAEEGQEIRIKLYIPCVTVVVLALSMVRDLKRLAPLSLISNILILTSIAIILVYVFQDLPSIQDRPNFISIGRFPVFFSTCVFALEGITVVMPLENNMIKPTHFTGCFRVLNTSMTIIVCIYAFLGFFGYLKYGSEIKGSISLNLPEEDPLAQTAQIALGVAVAFTYPLQFYCGMNFTWPTVKEFLEKRKPSLSGLTGEYIYRVVLVFITMCVGLAIPNLGSLMGLIGAVCLSTVGIMFPPVLETLVYWNDLGPGKWLLWKNICIFIFGFIGFSTGLYTSMVDIIHSFSE
ncbi:hypothetical protein B566_EDAN016111 [Ephemera danica]|nr:hypothetical protein B566_EDAN016111 [Ephemera danica]